MVACLIGLYKLNVSKFYYVIDYHSVWVSLSNLFSIYTKFNFRLLNKLGLTLKQLFSNRPKN